MYYWKGSERCWRDELASLKPRHSSHHCFDTQAKKAAEKKKEEDKKKAAEAKKKAEKKAAEDKKKAEKAKAEKAKVGERGRTWFLCMHACMDGWWEGGREGKTRLEISREG